METKPVEFIVEPDENKPQCFYFFSDFSPYPGDQERMQAKGIVDFYIRFEENENYPGNSGFIQRVKREMMDEHPNELENIAKAEALNFLRSEKYPFKHHKYLI